ncbi:Lipase (class 3) [Rhizoctonia solani]|uniref:Lipase (Class 3) n=1 Tax=Rhizoctonia solani TaxID=456999 RepID=A0A8H7HDZ5_9AGAM|nr:Lipase (class 3) [Rhizoctonia solani]
MSDPTLNAHQQVFRLSLFANIVREIKGDLDSIQIELENRLPVAVNQVPGWKVVWGPVAWKHKPDDTKTGADHVSFVARHPNLVYSNGEEKETYVFAVAGSVSEYNWVINNARVDSVVDLHKWLEKGITTAPKRDLSPSLGNAYISYGTAVGVYRLATAVPPKTSGSPGVELASYWAGFPESPNTRVIFAGHSLGAALTSTLALSLLESRAFAKFPASNILVYPSAGPAVGNITFARLFAKKFPKIAGPRYEVWNCMIVNRLDPVSQAWCNLKLISPEQNLDNIPTLYGEPIKEIVSGVNMGKVLAALSTVTYMPIQAVRFHGDPPATSPSTQKEFFDIVWYQHLEEYLKFIGIDAPESQLLVKDAGVGKMSNEEVTSCEPVIAELFVLPKTQEGAVDAAEDYKSLQALSVDVDK